MAQTFRKQKSTAQQWLQVPEQRHQRTQAGPVRRPLNIQDSPSGPVGRTIATEPH